MPCPRTRITAGATWAHDTPIPTDEGTPLPASENVRSEQNHAKEVLRKAKGSRSPVDGLAVPLPLSLFGVFPVFAPVGAVRDVEPAMGG